MNWKRILFGSEAARNILMKSDQLQTRINEGIDGLLEKTPTITLGVRGVIHGVRKTLGLSK